LDLGIQACHKLQLKHLFKHIPAPLTKSFSLTRTIIFISFCSQLFHVLPVSCPSNLTWVDKNFYSDFDVKMAWMA